MESDGTDIGGIIRGNKPVNVKRKIASQLK